MDVRALNLVPAMRGALGAAGIARVIGTLLVAAPGEKRVHLEES